MDNTTPGGKPVKLVNPPSSEAGLTDSGGDLSLLSDLNVFKKSILTKRTPPKTPISVGLGDLGQDKGKREEQAQEERRFDATSEAVSNVPEQNPLKSNLKGSIGDIKETETRNIGKTIQKQESAEEDKDYWLASWEAMERLQAKVKEVISKVAECLEIVDTNMLRNNPRNVKDSMTTARELMGVLEDKVMAIEEERKAVRRELQKKRAAGKGGKISNIGSQDNGCEDRLATGSRGSKRPASTTPEGAARRTKKSTEKATPLIEAEQTSDAIEGTSEEDNDQRPLKTQRQRRRPVLVISGGVARGTKKNTGNTTPLHVAEQTRDAMEETNEEDDDEQPWETQRQGRKHRNRNRNRNPYEGDGAGNKKVDSRTIGLPRRRSEAIKVSAKQGVTYADILKKLNSSEDLKENEEVLRVRRTRKDELLIVLKKNKSSEAFNQKVAKSIQDMAELKPLYSRPTLEIRDIDEMASKEEVIEGVNKVLGGTSTNNEIDCTMLRGYAGMQIALIKLPGRAAENILNKGKVRIGLVNCRVRTRLEVNRCYKCLGFGHLARDCHGPDRRGCCWRCGAAGHQMKECKKDATCIICKDKGIQGVDHMAGSGKCPSFRAALKNLRQEQWSSSLYR